MKSSIVTLTPLLVTSAAMAGDLTLSVEIPRLEVAEYHRPYVAIWIEKADKSLAANLSVWYDVGQGDAKGETWLKDLRQWWRKSGRSLKMPVDGVSGPTKPAGTHKLTIPAGPIFQAQPDVEYALVVEASREVGGREIVRIPFKWDGKAPLEASAKGETELGKVQISIKPKS